LQSERQTASVPKSMVWLGGILSALAVLFLLFDGTVKVLKLPPAVEATSQLGYPARLLVVIGVVELLCTIVYVIPRTSVLGAILLTAFLGGAVASHARLDSPLFTHSLFPVYVALLVWGGLFLRDRRLRDLVPVRSSLTTNRADESV
jgi:hypothetical protein